MVLSTFPNSSRSKVKEFRGQTVDREVYGTVSASDGKRDLGPQDFYTGEGTLRVERGIRWVVTTQEETNDGSGGCVGWDFLFGEKEED